MDKVENIPPNPIPDAEPEDLRAFILKMFGEESVKEIDRHWVVMHNIRMASDTNLDFLKIARDHYQGDGEKVVAALLYGMKIGELAATYVHEQQKTAQKEKSELPGFCNAN